MEMILEHSIGTCEITQLGPHKYLVSIKRCYENEKIIDSIFNERSPQTIMGALLTRVIVLNVSEW